MLVDLAVTRDRAIIALFRAYGDDPARFARHALFNVRQNYPPPNEAGRP